MESATKNNTQFHKPKKKKRKTITKVEATISMHKEKPDKNAPTLGYYPSGFDPLTRIKKNLDSSSNPIKFYRNQKKLSRVEVVIKPKEVEVDFVGTSHGGDGAVLTMNSFALGVLDKSSQILTISPVNTNKVFRLQPLARSSHMSDKEPETPAKEATVEDTRDQKNSLLKRYGTKTAITKANKAFELRRQEDDGSQLEVSQAIENTPIDKEAIASSNTDTSRDIPPHDLSATLPEKAYLLEKIITKGEWAYVRDILDLLQAGKEIKSDFYPSFVCNRCYKVEVTKDEAEKERLAGIMSYIAYLIEFKNRYSLIGSTSSKHQRRIPDMLLMKFKKMFLDAEKNRLADEKIGSLISYVLVLTLFIDEFQTDFTDIAMDLKTPSIGLRPYLENLGCQFKRRNNVTVAHLPVPLKFPTMRKKRGRG